MPQRNNYWTARQFAEKVKEIARAYERFSRTRELQDLDQADLLHEELNETYNLSLQLMFYVSLGRALMAK